MYGWHVYALPVCCNPPPVVRIGCQILGIWIIVMPPCVYWEPNQNLLQKQKVFLTAKPSHQPQIKNKSLKKNLKKKKPCNKITTCYITPHNPYENQSATDWICVAVCTGLFPDFTVCSLVTGKPELWMIQEALNLAQHYMKINLFLAYSSRQLTICSANLTYFIWLWVIYIHFYILEIVTICHIKVNFSRIYFLSFAYFPLIRQFKPF